MPKVELKSIMPIRSDSAILFAVTVTINGEPQKPWYVNDPEKLLDFARFRVDLVKRTGYYLSREMAERWDAIVEEVWEDPEELPKRSEDLRKSGRLDELTELFQEEKKKHKDEVP